MKPAVSPVSVTSFQVRPFQPAWWLPGPHTQTLAGRFLRPRQPVRFTRERLETEDGDFLDVDEAGSDARLASDAPVVLVVHGLEGGSGASYVLQSCRALAAHGIRPVALNFRSCSGEPNRAARFYHAGDTADLAHVLAWIRQRFPGAPVGTLGFSLGANVVLKYLGEQGAQGNASVCATVAVSVPFDLRAAAGQLEGSPMGRVYTAAFLRSLRAKFRAKGSTAAAACDARRVLAARTFREFDDAATARLHGFRDVEHYYAESSSAGYIAAIRVPTLVLHSRDDPFLPAAAIPHRALAANPYIVPGLTERGGHVGFIGGSPGSPHWWAEAEAARFLAFQLGSRAGMAI